uniref:Xylulose kinase-1 n=1 Tax=Tanacetum cinerariifolium TaxID=118510 RepID=A0A6L2L6Z4_TANCI|nr:hypothetical protein [Tanacetum cinerariifolium]
MIEYLSKSDASEGFNQIINFVNGSSIKYALTVIPNIYVSCIKQFWTTVAIKKVNDVTRSQALVDKKKVVVTESTIRDALYLDGAEGVECLPNEEIFAELARMGYEKPSTKLTFYKAFFSNQNQVGDLLTHTTKYTSPTLTQIVFANMRRVGKGFYGVKTPLFKGMLVAQEVKEGDADERVEEVNAGFAAEGDVSAANDEVPTSDAGLPMDLLQNLLDTCKTLTRRVKHLEQDKIAQALEITKLKSRVKKLERRFKASKLKRLKNVGTAQRIETSDDTVMDDISNQERMIADMDADDDVVLEEAKDVAADVVKDVQDADIAESVHDQERQAESQVEIYKIDLEHANKVLSMQEDETEPAEVQKVVDVVTTAKIITEVVIAASATFTTASTYITAADAQVLIVVTTAAPSRLTASPRRRK